MILLVAILVSGLLFVGFLSLTFAEARSGKRVFGFARRALDQKVENVGAVVRRADLGSLIFHGARAVIEYLVRLIVHGILVAVRAVERFLTRTAHSLRTREEMLMSSRTFLSAWVERAKRRFKKKEDTVQ